MSLVASGIRMAFGGVVGLAEGGVTVEPGRIGGLIGRNGSGKSTLFNCMTGFCRPSGGTVTADGRDITRLPPPEIVRHGVVRTFQTPRIDPETSVETAVQCGFYGTARWGLLPALAGWPAALREERALIERADQVLHAFGLSDLRTARLGRLAMGQVRLVEVARAMASDARYILLDEPAAGLTRPEQEVLAARIRAVAATGVGVLLVEHNFALIRALCERVTVLDEGRVLCTGSPEEVARDERVLRSYLGAAAEIAAVEAAA